MTNVEIIIQSGKIKTINDIMNHIDLVSDLLKEDVEQILKSKGLVTNEFDAFFADGLKKLKHALMDKKYLRGVKRFFRCDSVENALKLFLMKLTSNVRNEYQVERRKSSLAHVKQQAETYMIELEQVQKDTFEMLLNEEDEILLNEEQKMVTKEWKNSFNKMVENGKISGELTKCGNTQLVLVFDDLSQNQHDNYSTNRGVL